MARDCQQLSGGRASPPLRRPTAAGASFRRIPAPRSGAAEGLLPTSATPRAARALVPRPRGGTTTTSSHARATQVFEVFSSFTTLASFLAFAVELQYGGRIPFFAGRTELCSLVFLGLTGAVVSLPKRTMIKKVPQLPLRPCVVHGRTLQSGSRRPVPCEQAVNLLALSGILYQRITAPASALLSLSFAATLACWGLAVKQLLAN